MATLIQVTVDTGGTGDYTSLNAAFAAIPADLQVADEQWDITCYATTGVYDGTAATLSDKNSDSTRFVRVIAGEDHGGAWQSAQYYIETGGFARSLSIQSPHTQVIGIQAQKNTSDNYNYTADVLTDFCLFDSCIFRSVGGGGSACTAFRFSNTITGQTYIRNCLFEGDGTQLGCSCTSNGDPLVTLQNCTVANCDRGFKGAGTSSTNLQYVNCLAHNCVDPFDNIKSGEGSNCADSLGDAVALGFANSIQTSSSFVAGTYQPSIGSDLEEAGLNLYSEFQSDIAGNTRPSSGGWTIGAFTVEAPEPTPDPDPTPTPSLRISGHTMLSLLPM